MKNKKIFENDAINYYKNKKRILKLEDYLDNIDNEIERLKKMILTNDLSIDVFKGRSSCISESIRSNNGSYIEKNMILAYEELEKNLWKTQNKKIIFNCEYNKLKVSNEEFEIFLNELESIEKEIFELKYSERKSNMIIAISMNYGESTVRKKINEILKKYKNWLEENVDKMKIYENVKLGNYEVKSLEEKTIKVTEEKM